MKVDRIIQVVDSHTAGESTRVVLGAGPIPGASMVEKEDYVIKNQDSLRLTVLNEPRGHKGMVGALLTEPTSDEASFGVIFMDFVAYVDMCIHGSIGLVTTALECGIVSKVEPETKVVFDSLAGTIAAFAQVRSGDVHQVSVYNVPSFFYRTHNIRDPLLDSVELDIAFGGNFYGIVSGKQIGVRVRKGNISELVRLGSSILNSANSQIKVEHPTIGHINKIHGILIFDTPEDPAANSKNIVIGPRGMFDRSPCGTGTSARIAALHAKGHLRLDEPFINESILGTTFTGTASKKVQVGNITGIIPKISGSAYLTGFTSLIISRDDPLATGFSFP